MSEGNTEFRMSAGVAERLREKDELAKEMDSFSIRLGKAGYNVFKWGFAYPAGFLAEFLMPPGTSWLNRLIPIGVGWGLEKLARLNPGYEKSNFSRLIGTLGGGLYRGGAFGLASTMVLNTVFEPQARIRDFAVPSNFPEVVKDAAPIHKHFTERVIEGVAGMPANKAFVMGGGPDVKMDIMGGLGRLDKALGNFLRIK